MSTDNYARYHEVGLVRELRNAEKEIKRNPKSVSAHLHMAETSCTLRQFHKARAAASLAFNLLKTTSRNKKKNSGMGSARSRIKACIRRSDAELSVVSEVDKDSYKEDDQDPDFDIDSCPIWSETEISPVTNTNWLHFSCLTGDVRLLEDVVARGAALDYPYLPLEEIDANCHYCPAPPGATALIMQVALLAYFRSRSQGAAGRSRMNKAKECAIRLVMLGANLDVTLVTSPEQGTHPFQTGFSLNDRFRAEGYEGKTIRELAKLSGHRDLLDAIETMSKRETELKAVQCRCGSRLPWAQCHAFDKRGGPAFMDFPADGIWFRFSPTARCPCAGSLKSYYQCCWFETTPVFFNDSSAKLRRNIVARKEVTDARELYALAKAGGFDPLATMLFRMQTQDTNDYSLLASQLAHYVRNVGLSVLGTRFGPKCKVATSWDKEVVAGCIERMENQKNPFIWIDTHWNIGKIILKARRAAWKDVLR